MNRITRSLLSVVGVGVFALLAVGSGDSEKKAERDSEADAEKNRQAAQIGEMARVGYFEITVNGARRSKTVKTKYDIETAADGSMYLILDVTVKCVDTESRTFLEGSAFAAYEGKELEYDKREIIMGTEMFSGGINPLTKKTGQIIYQVPAELDGPYYWEPGRGEDVRFVLGTLQIDH